MLQWLLFWLVPVVVFALYLALGFANRARSIAVQKATMLSIHAEAQDKQWADGDDTGIYGEFPPAV